MTLKQKQEIVWLFMIGNEPWSIIQRRDGVELIIDERQIRVIREFCNGKFKLPAKKGKVK